MTIEQLFIDAENWNKAKVAEHYISAMEEQAVQKNEMNSNTKDYISWAREVIKSHNSQSKSVAKKNAQIKNFVFCVFRDFFVDLSVIVNQVQDAPTY